MATRPPVAGWCAAAAALQVSAGAKTGPDGEDDEAGSVIGDRRVEMPFELGQERAGEGVAVGWGVEGDRGHAAGD
jgi:hypothetical protein